MRAEAAPYKPLFEVGNDLIVSRDFHQAQYTTQQRDKMLAVVQQAIDEVLEKTDILETGHLPERLPVYFGCSSSYHTSLVLGDTVKYSSSSNGVCHATIPSIEGLMLYNITPECLETAKGIADIRKRVHAMALHAVFHPTINVSSKSVRNAIASSLAFHFFDEKTGLQDGGSSTGFVTPDSKEIYFRDGLGGVTQDAEEVDLHFAQPSHLLSSLRGIHMWQHADGGFRDPTGALMYPPNALVTQGLACAFPEPLRKEVLNLPSLRPIQAGRHVSFQGDDNTMFITQFEVTENSGDFTEPHSHTIRKSDGPQFDILMNLRGPTELIAGKLLCTKDITHFCFPFREYARKLFTPQEMARAATLNIQLITKDTGDRPIDRTYAMRASEKEDGTTDWRDSA